MRGMDEFAEGKCAYVAGVPREDNPYERGSRANDQWDAGWLDMNLGDPLLDDDEREEAR